MGNANTNKKAIVNTSFLRVRVAPRNNGAIIGLLKQGAVVQVTRVIDGWAQAEINVGGSAMRLQSSPEPVAAYMMAQYLTFDTVREPPPTPTPSPSPSPSPTPSPSPSPTPAPAAAAFRLGLNALQNVPQATEEARRGCKYFLIMNDFGGAGNLKRAFPDATVMVRRYFPQNFFLSAEQVLEGLEGANHGPLVYTGFNEADQGDHRGSDLVKRARIDIAVARMIKQRNPGAVYAAGTFSMGTPDFTNPDVCRILREEYAPHYNSGLIGFDMHLYTPTPPHIDQPAEYQWFERRWEFLFTKCGFDPNVRAIYCGETGLDQGGIGGFPAHGSTHEYFRTWCAKTIALQSAPMVINGKSYPSPIIGGAIFQLGGNGDQRWAGYDVTGYLPILRDFYNGLPKSAARKNSVSNPRAKAGGTVAASNVASPLSRISASSKTAAERLKHALTPRGS